MSIAPDDDMSYTAPPAPPRPVVLAPPPAPGGNPRADSLNLAQRPFGNSRPVVRISLLFWLLGLALLLSNVFVFRKYLSDSADKRARIAHGVEELQRQQKAVSDLQTRLNGYDLVRLNDQIDFLNTQIDTRTFSWSLLIDRIADTLPSDVRLNRLTPETDEKTRAGRRERGAQHGKLPDGGVQLRISGQSRRDEALIRFVDNLFAHPSFRDPNLIQESQMDTGGPVVRFEATVTYLPGGPPHSVHVEEAPAGVAGAPGTEKGTARKKTATSVTSATTSKTTTTVTRAPGGRP